MITPEQQAQWQQFQQSSGFKPSATAAPSAYDAVDSLIAQKKAATPSDLGTVAGGIGDAFNKRADNLEKIKESTDSLPSKILQLGGEGAGVVNDTAGEVIKSVVKPEVLQSMGEHLAPLVEAAQKTPAGQAVINWWQSLKPETQRNLSATGEIASLLSNAVGGGVAKDAAVPALDAAKAAATTVAEKVMQPGVDIAKAGVKSAVGTVKDATITPLKDITQKAAAEGKIPGIEGLGEQAKTSSERLAEQAPLIGAGAARKAKPLDVYNMFASQEAKHLADIKQDPAISLVGERIGDAFDKVVKQRSKVGKTMSSELEKTATKPVDTGPALGNLQKELLDNGAKYDSVNRQIITGNSSKFSSTDKTILNRYAVELQQLGSNPTMKSLDAFVSRMPKEIDGLKAEKGITFNTNAERIIKGNLSDLRDALTKTGTKKYAAARKQYSDLSNFVNEGATHLGKITQSGDFAKDASLAKSSVQSVLNNGKKDWLIKLEGLTGYPALDESVLALQAMKDAGDFKGNSLLELLTEGAQGGVPTTPAGLTGKILGFMGKQAGKAVAGSKADQTRAFLKSLKQP